MDALVVAPNPVAGLAPNKLLPPNAPDVLVAAGCPKIPPAVLFVVGAGAPNALPPVLPNVEVVPPPKAPNPVAGLGAPNSPPAGAALFVLLFANAPVHRLSDLVAPVE